MIGRAHALAFALVALAAAWLGVGSAFSEPVACQARASRSSQPVPVRVDFQALSAAGTPPLTYHWDFGDGASSTVQNPSHVYTQVGFYDAVLTVTDAGAPAEVCRDSAFVTPGVFSDPLCISTSNTRWSEDPNPIQFDADPAFIFDPPPYT